jgi:hypothetical protein
MYEQGKQEQAKSLLCIELGRFWLSTERAELCMEMEFYFRACARFTRTCPMGLPIRTGS